MKRRQKNAFTARGSGGLPGPGTSLAGMLSPLRAALEKTGFGCELTLSPIRFADALAVWFDLAPDSSALTLLFSLSPTDDEEDGVVGSVAKAAQRLGVDTVDAFENGACVVAAGALRELAGMLEPAGMMAVLVDGPIEAGDAEAMIQAARAGQTPLEAEIRAVAALRAKSDHSVVLQARNPLHAAALVAENFRHYLAALRNRPAGEFSRPEYWQLERLLSLTGALTVRPIETEIFSTSIDVGISTDPDGRPRPADRSLIYDIFSRTWHDEP
ncbi:MAG: hypothetical protein JSV91_09985 [Phycisphaerales bacterium]|nr:MAG: hypothetical protein JSV91_09985 [Phycisphaerales bacterium]